MLYNTFNWYYTCLRPQTNFNYVCALSSSSSISTSCLSEQLMIVNVARTHLSLTIIRAQAPPTFLFALTLDGGTQVMTSTHRFAI